MSARMHVRRGWGSDPFAPACGCPILPCGHVDAATECAEHSASSNKTIRSAHRARDCKENR